MFDSDIDPARAPEAWDPAELRWSDDDCDPALPEPRRGLILRPWRAQDLDRFVALLDDPEVWKYLPEAYPDPLDKPMAAELIALSNAAGHHVVRAVVLDGLPVGQVRLSFRPGDNQRRRAEIGYWLGRPHWGQRLAGDMVTRFSAQCFAMIPGLEQQFARIHKANTPSRRVLERGGFRFEGPCADHEQFDILVRDRSPAS